MWVYVYNPYRGICCQACFSFQPCTAFPSSMPFLKRYLAVNKPARAFFPVFTSCIFAADFMLFLTAVTAVFCTKSFHLPPAVIYCKSLPNNHIVRFPLYHHISSPRPLFPFGFPPSLSSVSEHTLSAGHCRYVTVPHQTRHLFLSEVPLSMFRILFFQPILTSAAHRIAAFPSTVSIPCFQPFLSLSQRHLTPSAKDDPDAIPFLPNLLRFGWIAIAFPSPSAALHLFHIRKTLHRFGKAGNGFLRVSMGNTILNTVIDMSL